MSDFDIDELAKAIARQINVPLEDQLWDAEDCARYFKMSRESFLKYKAPQPSFPKPHGPGHPRWFAGEVIRYARTSRAA